MTIFISTRQAVEETGLSAATIRELAKSGKVNYIRVGSNFKIRRDSLVEYLTEASKGQSKTA